MWKLWIAVHDVQMSGVNLTTVYLAETHSSEVPRHVDWVSISRLASHLHVHRTDRYRAFLPARPHHQHD